MKQRKSDYEIRVYSHRGHRYEVSVLNKQDESLGFFYYIFASDNPNRSIKETRELFESHGNFHCGITFCQKILTKTFDENPEDITWMQDHTHYKIGCDYMHYWDEGVHYDWDCVCFDAEKTIDCLIDAGLLEKRDPLGIHPVDLLLTDGTPAKTNEEKSAKVKINFEVKS